MAEAAPAPAATPTAAPEATNGKPAAGTRELAEHYAKQAARAVLKDAQEAADGMAAARGDEAPAEDTKDGGTPERGKDGKFKPKAKAAKPAAEAGEGGGAGDVGVEPGETGEAPPADRPDPGTAGLGRARKLIREGNIAAALELIGLHPDKLEGKQWGAFRQREKAAQDAERKAAEREQGLKQIHAQLVQHYGQYDAARKAYEAEDYDEAFKIWTGETPDDFTRKRIHAMHSKTKDPEVIKLRKELEALRTEKQTEEQRRQQVAAEEGRKQARDNYRSQLATQLGELDDPRFSRVAKKQAFINKVFDIQEQHWNEQTQATLDTVEAAELAWEELYEGVAGETSTTAASTVSKPAGTAKTPVRPVAKATTSLNTREASEASPAHKLTPGSPELRNFYARKAELAALGLEREGDAG